MDDATDIEHDKSDGQTRNLADLILEKIAAHEAAQAGQAGVHSHEYMENAIELPTKVVEVYTK